MSTRPESSLISRASRLRGRLRIHHQPTSAGEVTAVGINFERKASRAILDGGGATVSGFNQGVVIIGYEANRKRLLHDCE